MDESGDNVFFTTRDRLTEADHDELIDLYDARVGGGFPESPPARECHGEECQAQAQSPALPPPASASFHGEGNPAPARPASCKKGKVRRGERCVTKRKKRKRKGKQARHRHGARQTKRQRGGSK